MLLCHRRLPAQGKQHRVIGMIIARREGVEEESALHQPVGIFVQADMAHAEGAHVDHVGIAGQVLEHRFEFGARGIGSALPEERPALTDAHLAIIGLDRRRGAQMLVGAAAETGDIMACDLLPEIGRVHPCEQQTRG